MDHEEDTVYNGSAGTKGRVACAHLQLGTAQWPFSICGNLHKQWLVQLHLPRQLFVEWVTDS